MDLGADELGIDPRAPSDAISSAASSFPTDRYRDAL